MCCLTFDTAWLSSVTVTCDREAVGSTLGRVIIKWLVFGWDMSIISVGLYNQHQGQLSLLYL